MTDVDCRLAVTDSPVGDLPVKINCPEHFKRIGKEDGEASLAVYPDHLHCFGCGWHVKYRMHALAYLLGIKPDQAREVASKYTYTALDGYRTRVSEEARRTPLPGALATVYQGMLLGPAIRGHRRVFLHEHYGLADWMIDRAMIGHDSTRFTIPFYQPNNDFRSPLRETLVTIRFRRDDEYGVETWDGKPLPKYTGMQGRNGLYLYPEHWIDRDRRHYLVVTEGEFKALRLWQENIPAVSVTNGAGNLHKVPALIRKSYPRITHLYLAADRDEAGIVASTQTVQAAVDAGFRVSVASWDPEWGKGVDDLYKGGRTLKEVEWNGSAGSALPD